ncbi:MAG: hypothetical protein LBN71_02190 [Tannerella sp.]|nr:hypothetical protein [Tannerella sp.]
MKTKFDLEKSIIAGILSVFVLSALFTGCGKSYDDDIYSLIRRTNVLDSASKAHDILLQGVRSEVATINSKLNNLKSISSVEPTSTGYVIRFSDNTTITITNGTAGTMWVIGPGYHTGTREDSLWYMNGQKVEPEAVAIPRAGLPGKSAPSPDISPSGYWVVYDLDAAGNYNERETTYPVVSNLLAYVTDNPDNLNQWILWVRKGVTGTAFEQVILPKNPAGGVASGSIGLIGFQYNANPTNSISLSGMEPSTLGDLDVKYWHIDSIYDVTNSAKLTEWIGVGPDTIKPKQLLIAKAALVISGDANPGLALKNSNGELLPLKTGTPVKYTGLLTKASEVAGGAIYYVPLSVTNQTYENTTGINNNFRSKFRADAVYYLENSTGVKSNYSSFSITATNITSPTAITPASVATLRSAGGSTVSVTGSACTIKVSELYTVGFDATNGGNVYNYRIDDGGSTDIDVFDELGAFRILDTGASFSLTIQMLHIDGKIHEETLDITVTD